MGEEEEEEEEGDGEEEEEEEEKEEDDDEEEEEKEESWESVEEEIVSSGFEDEVPANKASASLRMRSCVDGSDRSVPKNSLRRVAVLLSFLPESIFRGAERTLPGSVDFRRLGSPASLDF